MFEKEQIRMELDLTKLELDKGSVATHPFDL